jgi:hypothetical protein
MVTVTGTENLMMAATLAEGTTTIINAAAEPEVADLVTMLNAMGARIRGGGTHTLEVEGVRELHGVRHRVLPDRLEAGTLALAAATTGGEVELEEAVAAHLDALIWKMREAGACVEGGDGWLRVSGDGKYRAVSAQAVPYPGLATDLHPPLAAFLTQARGVSVIHERVFDNRLLYIGELRKMGADVITAGQTAIISGPTPLYGTRVRALDDRLACEITFPRLLGYRWELPTERLTASFDESSFVLSTQLLPTRTENWPIVGERTVDTLDALKAHRLQEVAFSLARLTLEKYFRDDEGADKPWLFPQLLKIARDWLEVGVICKDNCFKQMLLLEELAHDAADCIHRAIARGEAGVKRLKPILRPYDTIGSTRYVDFDTTRPVYVTDPEKCHISHVVADTDSWEQKMAQVLEDMPEVVSYVKNQNLGFWIPYTWGGEEKNYQPDFIVRLRDWPRAAGEAEGDILNLIVEVSREPRPDKAAKTAAARDLWVPAVNNHGGFGRWDFLEITDPWDAANTMRGYMASKASEG